MPTVFAVSRFMGANVETQFPESPKKAAMERALVALAWFIPIIALLTGWFLVEQWGTLLLPAILVLIWHRACVVDPNTSIRCSGQVRSSAIGTQIAGERCHAQPENRMAC